MEEYIQNQEIFIQESLLQEILKKAIFHQFLQLFMAVHMKILEKIKEN